MKLARLLSGRPAVDPQEFLADALDLQPAAAAYPCRAARTKEYGRRYREDNGAIQCAGTMQPEHDIFRCDVCGREAT